MGMADVKHRAMFEILRREILLGKFNEREKFPSEGQLCRRFGASRNTVRLALADLKKNGIIETRSGSGTFLSAYARKSTGYIGLILPDYGNCEIFTQISGGIATGAVEEGYSLLFGNASYKNMRQRAEQALAIARDYAERHVAGVILEPVELIPDRNLVTREIVKIFTEKHIPVLLLDRDFIPPPDRSNHDLVGISNTTSAYKLANYMISRGAKELRFFVRPDSAYTTRLRAHGVALAAIDASP